MALSSPSGPPFAWLGNSAAALPPSVKLLVLLLRLLLLQLMLLMHVPFGWPCAQHDHDNGGDLVVAAHWTPNMAFEIRGTEEEPGRLQREEASFCRHPGISSPGTT